MLDKASRHDRNEGALVMRRELVCCFTINYLSPACVRIFNFFHKKDSRRDDLGLLLPYAASYVRFLGAIMGKGDASPKAVLHCLECHAIMVVIIDNLEIVCAKSCVSPL